MEIGKFDPGYEIFFLCTTKEDKLCLSIQPVFCCLISVHELHNQGGVDWYFIAFTTLKITSKLWLWYEAEEFRTTSCVKTVNINTLHFVWQAVQLSEALAHCARGLPNSGNHMPTCGLMKAWFMVPCYAFEQTCSFFGLWNCQKNANSICSSGCPNSWSCSLSSQRETM